MIEPQNMEIYKELKKSSNKSHKQYNSIFEILDTNFDILKQSPKKTKKKSQSILLEDLKIFQQQSLDIFDNTLSQVRNLFILKNLKL